MRPLLAPASIAYAVLGLSLLAVTAGCDDDPECKPDHDCAEEVVEVHEEGEACLVDVTSAPYGTAVNVEADEAVTVRVGFGDCAPCGDKLDSTCTVSVEGSQVVVAGTSSWVPLDSADCPADCKPWFAECTSDPLATGDYVLAYGAGAKPFSVPSTGAIICADAEARAR